MSNTNITNIQVTDTFQGWLDRTNELIDLANENVMLAGPGSGFTVQGNSTLSGSFTANQLISDSASIDNISTVTLQRSTDANESITSSSPIKIETSVENIFDLETTTGNRPLFRLINGGNARWVIGHQTSSSSSGISISTEGASTPQIAITQAGRVIANEFQGDGSLLTGIVAENISGTIDPSLIPDLDASKITTGVFDNARIPDLDASKITTGTFAVARIPNLNASKITAGTFADARIPNLDASKITTGTLADARIPNLDASKITSGTFADARIPNLNASKITAGVVASARLPESATRSEISLSNLTNPASSVQGFVSGRRFMAALDQEVSIKNYEEFVIEPENSSTTYTREVSFTPLLTKIYLRFRTNKPPGYIQGDLIDVNSFFTSTPQRSMFTINAIRGNSIILRTRSTFPPSFPPFGFGTSWNDFDIIIRVWG